LFQAAIQLTKRYANLLLLSAENLVMWRTAPT